MTDFEHGVLEGLKRAREVCRRRKTDYQGILTELKGLIGKLEDQATADAVRASQEAQEAQKLGVGPRTSGTRP